MEQTILAFFQDYAAASNRGDDQAAAAAFAPDFLYADENGSKIVRREAIRAGIARRREALTNSGAAGPTALEHIETTPLDDRLALAKTVWRIHSPSSAPLTLHSTFLVELRDGTPQIIAYLAHVSLPQALRQRASSDSQ